MARRRAARHAHAVRRAHAGPYKEQERCWINSSRRNRYTYIWLFLTFSICYTYQLYYVFVVLTPPPPKRVAKKNHRFAVVVSARNERAVIADLIHSIKVQNYPQELIDVFVIADNCTDDTAEVAREGGAIVFPRTNAEQVGKGYALDYGFSVIRSQYADRGYEAYFV